MKCETFYHWHASTLLLSSTCYTVAFPFLPKPFYAFPLRLLLFDIAKILRLSFCLLSHSHFCFVLLTQAFRHFDFVLVQESCSLRSWSLFPHLCSKRILVGPFVVHRTVCSLCGGSSLCVRMTIRFHFEVLVGFGWMLTPFDYLPGSTILLLSHKHDSFSVLGNFSLDGTFLHIW